MADSNNHRAGQLPGKPYPELRQLDRLLGRWRVDGPFLPGFTSYEWMEGGWFLVQHVDAQAGGRPVKGVQYIGFDEDTRTLRSHLMDVHGSNFTYTWQVDGDTLTICSGERGSDSFFQGRFSDDGTPLPPPWTR